MISAARDLLGGRMQLERTARRVFGERSDRFGGADDRANAATNILQRAARLLGQLCLIVGALHQRFRAAGDDLDPFRDRGAARSDAAEEAAKIRSRVAEAASQLPE